MIFIKYEPFEAKIKFIYKERGCLLCDENNSISVVYKKYERRK